MLLPKRTSVAYAWCTTSRHLSVRAPGDSIISTRMNYVTTVISQSYHWLCVPSASLSPRLVKRLAMFAPISIAGERSASRGFPRTDVGYWHFSDIPFVLDDVRSKGRSRNYSLVLSISHFDPRRTSGLHGPRVRPVKFRFNKLNSA